MSAQQLIEKLKALSLAHEAIAGTQGLVKKHVEQIKQKEATLALLASRLASLDSELKQAQKNIDAIDLDLASIQDQENKLQKKLKTLKKQKESVALEKELAILARKRYDQERALEAAWNTLTNLKQGHAPARSKIQQEESLVKTELSASTKTETSLKNKLTSGEQVWNDALSKIPEEWQTRYTRMLNSVPNPLILVFTTKEFDFLDSLNLPLETIFINADRDFHNAVDILWLLSKCRHHIFNNSTFYWWGATLSQTRYKSAEQEIYCSNNFLNPEIAYSNWKTF